MTAADIGLEGPVWIETQQRGTLTARDTWGMTERDARDFLHRREEPR